VREQANKLGGEASKLGEDIARKLGEGIASKLGEGKTRKLGQGTPIKIVDPWGRLG
jgi:hypothetical protein